MGKMCEEGEMTHSFGHLNDGVETCRKRLFVNERVNQGYGASTKGELFGLREMTANANFVGFTRCLGLNHNEKR